MGTRIAVPEMSLNTENLSPQGMTRPQTSVKENKHVEDPVAFILSGL
jgi:hypothetical protein